MPLADVLTPWLRRALDEAPIPGAAVGVTFGDETAVLCHGVVDTARNHPVTTSTLFQIASATKPFTATAVLVLHERGLIDLDAPLRTYLPDLQLGAEDAADEVTTRHLLTHTAGYDGDDSPIHDWGVDALARSMADFATLPRIFPPGTTMSYSNAGFRLLGILAERVAKKPYDEVVRDLVLDPLDMRSSVLLPWQALGRDVALGHPAEGDGPWPYAQWRTELPEGGMLSTIDDMMIWARYQLHGAPGVLTDALRIAAQQQVVEGSAPYAGIGMPWQIAERHGARIVSQGGNLSNVTVSSFDLAPEHGLGVCVLANARAGKALGDQLLRWCLENLAGLRPPPGLRTVPMDADMQTEYTGRYDLGLGSFIVEPRGTGLRVLIRANEDLAEAHDDFPPFDLDFLGEDRFGLAGGPGEVFCTFTRLGQGEPGVLHMIGRAGLRATNQER